MGYLTAAVFIVGLLCLLNLVLSLGLVRRLRADTDRVNRVLRELTPSHHDGVPVGEKVGDFTATTIDDQLVARDLLEGRTLVGFFSPGCQECATQLPSFLAHARSMPHGVQQVLAVVDSAGPDRATYLDDLTAVARVVLDGLDGPLRTAFDVAGFPMFYLVADDGVVLAAGYTMAEVAEDDR